MYQYDGCNVSKCDGDSWKAFAQALKEEFLKENLERVTKTMFLKWVVNTNKG